MAKLLNQTTLKLRLTMWYYGYFFIISHCFFRHRSPTLQSFGDGAQIRLRRIIFNCISVFQQISLNNPVSKIPISISTNIHYTVSNIYEYP